MATFGVYQPCRVCMLDESSADELLATQGAQNIESTLTNGCQCWNNVDSTLIQHWTGLCAHWEGTYYVEYASNTLLTEPEVPIIGVCPA